MFSYSFKPFFQFQFLLISFPQHNVKLHCLLTAINKNDQDFHKCFRGHENAERLWYIICKPEAGIPNDVRFLYLITNF